MARRRPAREPARILAKYGFHGAARSVAGRQPGAPETRDGVYETARTAASCLSDPQIMAWVTPSTPDLLPLDVTALPTSTDTLYLLSKDGAGSAAPLVAGLTDQVLRAAVRAAEMRGGRLDPPMLCVLDEAANICKISDLPQLYSHFGSRGILPITILQSYPQGARVSAAGHGVHDGVTFDGHGGVLKARQAGCRAGRDAHVVVVVLSLSRRFR